MYQLSRLLHDYHKDLYCHLEQQDIAPSLYAPPWFLTSFASQYPLGFVARVFGKFEGNWRMERNVCLNKHCVVHLEAFGSLISVVNVTTGLCS